MTIQVSARALLCFILLSIAASCSNPKKDRKDIQKVWENFTNYSANNMGADAVQLVDSGTIKYYSAMLPLIKNADSITVERLRLIQKMLVLGVRHNATREKILSMQNGKDLFIYCVQSGLLGSSKPDDKLSIKVLSIKDNIAHTQIIDSNNKPGVFFVFRKEDKQWKINMLYTYARYGNDMWENMIKESGATEREYFYFLLEYMTGEKPTNKIWHPVK